MSSHNTSSTSTIKECSICYIDMDNTNYVEYQINNNNVWKPAIYCVDCIQHLINTQYNTWVNKVNNIDCPVAFQRLINNGPPVYLTDKTAFADENNDEEVVCEVTSLWYENDNQIHSSKLKDALEGDERQKYWNSLAEINLPRIQKLMKEREEKK